MPYRTDLVYMYDGSFQGFLCCVYESYYERELPEFIFDLNEEQLTFFECREIYTDPKKATQVHDAVRSKISTVFLEFIQNAFLTYLPGKEVMMLNLVRKGFKLGSSVMDTLTDEPMHSLYKAVLHLGKEVQLYKGFVRFSDINGVLVSVIEPKNYVLPAMMEHFCDRYMEENFIIYDKTHSMMLLGEKGVAKLGSVDYFELGDVDYEERSFRRLWQTFYDTIGIKERYNPRCRMGMMPKRYWSQMTEHWEREGQNHAQLNAMKAELKLLDDNRVV